MVRCLYYRRCILNCTLINRGSSRALRGLVRHCIIHAVCDDVWDRDIINQGKFRALRNSDTCWRKVRGPICTVLPPPPSLDEPPLLAVLLLCPGRAQAASKILLIAKLRIWVSENPSRFLLITLFFSSHNTFIDFHPLYYETLSLAAIRISVKGQREKSASLGTNKNTMLIFNSYDRRYASGWESGKHLISVGLHLFL